MGGPAWLTDIFVAVMIAVAAYCVGRLVAARLWRRPTEVDADGIHVVMGVAMAGMLVAGLRFLPVGAGEAVFAGGGAWFAWQGVRARRGAVTSPWHCPHPLPHLVESGAMVYMFLALPALKATGGGAGMAGMGMSATASRFSLLALVLALFMFGYVAWIADRLRPRAPALVAVPAAAIPVRLLAPRCAATYKIAMGITMGYMLVLML